MAGRGDGKSKPPLHISFSDDAINWGHPIDIPGLKRWTNTSSAPAILGVKGLGLVLVLAGSAAASAPPSGALSTTAGSHSVATGKGWSGGMDLFSSKDGLEWTLLRHVWPFRANYASITALETGSDGAALSYAIAFEAGGFLASVELMPFMNFTA